MLVDFSYHPQIHDWGWISFYLKEVNAWDIILELKKVDFFLDFFILNTVYQGTKCSLTCSFPLDKYWLSLKTENSKFSQKFALIE